MIMMVATHIVSPNKIVSGVARYTWIELLALGAYSLESAPYVDGVTDVVEIRANSVEIDSPLDHLIKLT